MNKGLIFVIALLTLLGCSYQKYRYGFFEGNWVLVNYLDTVQKYRSVYRAQNQEMQEIYLQRHVDTLTFIQTDSILTQIPFTYRTSNAIVLNQPYTPKDLYLVKDSMLLCYVKNNVRYDFVKADDRLIDSNTTHGIPTATRRVINSLVLGGVYKEPNNAVPVQFYTNGSISGFSKAQWYEVRLQPNDRPAYAGDVVLFKSGQTSFWCTWEWQGLTLRFYKLIPHQHTFEKGALWIELFKIK